MLFLWQPPYVLFPLPPFFFKKCEKTKIPSTPSLPPMFSVSPPFLTLFLPLSHSLLSSHSLCLLSLSPPTHPSHWPLSLVRTLQAVAEQRSSSDDVLCEIFFVFFCVIQKHNFCKPKWLTETIYNAFLIVKVAYRNYISASHFGLRKHSLRNIFCK